MNVKKVYEATGDDCSAVVERFVSEETLSRFIVRFLSDDSFASLEKAMERGDVEAAFRAAHTLKGVAQNLGFSALGRSAATLTEILRLKTFDGSSEPFMRVSADYDNVVRAIRTYME